MQESIEERRLWIRLYFSSNTQHALFILLGWFGRSECYTIKEWFFILIIFRQLYFIIQFGKALNYSSLLVQVHSDLVQFYARVPRIWQSPFVIINPQTGNGAGVWMTSCPEEMVLRMWEFWKDVSWAFDRWKIELEIRPLRHAVEFFRSRPAEINCAFKRQKMCWALGWGQHSMVSISF